MDNEKDKDKAIFFDLFWTLIAPEFDSKTAENRLLGLTKEEWDGYQEEPVTAEQRYLGKVKDEDEMMRSIIAGLPFSVSEEKYRQVCDTRRERIRRGITEVKPEIMETLWKLKARGFKLCIISNADLMDLHYWKECPLTRLIDDAVFSCEVHMIKPDISIYRLAMEKVGVRPENSIFVGDGGSDELLGAHRAGMKTIFTEHFSVKEENRRERILKDADCRVERFKDILGYIRHFG